MESSERIHLTAAARREAVIDAAITEFAEKGLHGTSTEDIARRVGISQPYIFRLFGTKKDLFIAAAIRVYERVLASFQRAAAQVDGQGEVVLQAMGAAYNDLLANRAELLMVLQTFAACDDPDVQRAMRERFSEVYAYVRERSGMGPEQATVFFATGLLLNAAVALDLPMLVGCENWDDFKRDHGKASSLATAIQTLRVLPGPPRADLDKGCQ